ncbi:MAG TPA: peptide ABC transporter substrate-binding protein [Actinomycetota bacterium]|jgi:peptide/nickel transport system substrate-binding protein
MRLKHVVRAVALLGVVAIVATACGGGKKTPTGGATTTPPTKKGGSIVIGAEQWPECVNPITSCSSATWYWYSVALHVLPRAMVLDLHGNFIASPLLVEAPSLENGGVTQSPFTVTFKINPKAVWEDGSPITSADFEFTWKAITNTTGAYTTVGYTSIDSIDTSNPATAVIKFKEVFVDWPDLFGGVYQGIFKKAAFPTADAAKPNLKDEMQDAVPFSGGPWILKSWSKDQAVMVRNDKYYGKVANLDQVTIVPRTDQATEIQSLLTGEVSAIYPQPSDVSLLDQVSSNPNVKAVGSDGGYYEALWPNHDSAPLDDPKVREALMYAIDRQAVIDAIIKLNNPNAEVLNCGLLSFPNIGNWCQNKVFEQFTYDPDKSKSILESAGYDCSSTPCTKGGKKLVIEYSTVATNTRRTTTQELLKDKAKDAGIEFKIKNYEAGVLFGDIGPHGKFTLADFATGGSVDPSITSSLACENVPTAKNDFAGGNWNHWCNKQATDLMHQSDQELDPAKRLDLFNQIYALEAQDFLLVPLYVLPNVGAWRTDKITGPISDYIPSNLGMFFNINEWAVAS